jgi:uncharacterized protein Yka (UPF0111/DUF47 family)
MNLFKKLKSYILPKEVDFFGNLTKQSRMTEAIVTELYNIYISTSGDATELRSLITESKNMRTKNLIELNAVLITPVDREAISRAYVNLYWIVLSIKHLDMEIGSYDIKSLNEYENILVNLKQQMNVMSTCFQLLKDNKHSDVLSNVYQVIHLDNTLILDYSRHLNKLFDGKDMKHILQHKEILSQLKEISKRIHFCANSVEDIVFKMN